MSKCINDNVSLKTQREAFKDINRAKSRHKRKIWIEYNPAELGVYGCVVKRVDLPTIKYWYTNFSWSNELFIRSGNKYLAVEHSDGKHYILYQQKIVVPKEYFKNLSKPLTKKEKELLLKATEY